MHRGDAKSIVLLHGHSSVVMDYAERENGGFQE